MKNRRTRVVTGGRNREGKKGRQGEGQRKLRVGLDIYIRPLGLGCYTAHAEENRETTLLPGFPGPTCVT